MERKAEETELQAQMEKQMHQRLEMERRARDAFELKASMQRQIDQLRNERLIDQLQQAEREKRAELQKKVDQLEMKEQRAQMEQKLVEERATRKEMEMKMEMEMKLAEQRTQMEQKLAEERAMRKAGELKAERALIQGQVQQLKEALLQERHDRQRQLLVERMMSQQIQTLQQDLAYDNRADDLTKEGMLKGIKQAAAFILFLSSGVLERPYCQLEIRQAMALKKPIVLLHGEGPRLWELLRAAVLVHESDARYGSFDFRAAHAAAPADLQLLLDNTESLPFRRR
eukprot:g692.t1